MRTFNADGLALLARSVAGERIPFVPLIFFDTTSPQYWAACSVPLEWDGHTWEPLDISIGEIDDATPELNGLVLSFPGVTESQLAFAFDDLEGVTARVYHALVEPTTGEVVDAVLAWSGVLDTPGWEEGEQAFVFMSAEHRGASALRAKPSRYTDDEQQRLYPGDTSLDFDPATDAAPLVWPAASFFRV